MAKIINITDKLSLAKPQLITGEHVYNVNDSMETVLKFEELATAATMENMEKAIEISLGKKAVEELNIRGMSLNNFKVLAIGILAAMQDMEYDEAAARFQEQAGQ